MAVALAHEPPNHTPILRQALTPHETTRSPHKLLLHILELGRRIGRVRKLLRQLEGLGEVAHSEVVSIFDFSPTHQDQGFASKGDLNRGLERPSPLEV